MKRLQFMSVDGHMGEPRILEVSDEVAESLLQNGQFTLADTQAPPKASAERPAQKAPAPTPEQRATET